MSEVPKIKKCKDTIANISRYIQGRKTISVHHTDKVCLIDYGYELHYISRISAAKIIRKMRRNEWIELYDHLSP